ncbi:TetR/AcrR family transcriptional regulator [Glycomyces tenuis]|uniref:TetR/AcrR family transcriptional regulator n=1 Tax=Glycomyces tenuis TaxID=58116 RepID=UPI001B80CC90|nr:helix-turn-helix domain-containing protein [Glycomyces tenuis]
MSNIYCVEQPSKRERTRRVLAEHALELFERQGFEATSVGQIAAAAGVTEMTFFRHFGGKEQSVLTDPFDPVIAEAIGARPAAEAPLARTARGLRSALGELSETELGTVRRRVRLIACTPALRAAAAAQNEATTAAIGDRLTADGADPFAARVAAEAAIASLTAALYEWARGGRRTLAETIGAALDVLETDRA